MNNMISRRFWKENIGTVIMMCMFWVGCIFFLFTEDTGTAILFFADHRVPFLTFLAKNGTLLGEHISYIIATLGFTLFNIAKGVSVAITGVILLIIIFLLKLAFGHPRPKEIFSSDIDWDRLLVDGWHVVSGMNSFPSGHTAGAFALATVLALFINNKYVTFILAVLAIVVAWTRVYLVQHFVKDIFAGSFVGITIGLCAVFLYQGMSQKWKIGLIEKMKKK